MTLSQIRSQVEALKRKYALELEVYYLSGMALELCDEMTGAVTGEARSDSPKSVHEWVQAFFKRMRDRGFRQLNTFASLCGYLEKCLDRRVLPQVSGVLRSLLPWAARRGLIPRSVREVPFPPKKPTPAPQGNHCTASL